MILNEIGFMAHGNNDYSKANERCDEIIDNKPQKRLITEKEKKLPIRYWITKMHKKPAGARLI